MPECQYLHFEAGDTKGVCRYYPNNCPFGYCKVNKPKAVKTEPKEIMAPIVKYEPPAKEKRGRKAKYNWDRALPKMQKMRDALAPWADIAKATGIPKESLISRWKMEGMTIQKGEVMF